MMISILQVLTDQRVIIVGTVTTLAECLVVVVNTYRQLKKNNVSGPPKLSETKSRSSFLWSLNPINLFRPVP